MEITQLEGQVIGISLMLSFLSSVAFASFNIATASLRDSGESERRIANMHKTILKGTFAIPLVVSAVSLIAN